MSEEEIDAEVAAESDDSDGDHEIEEENESEEGDGDGDDEEDGEGNVGWANTFAKVLQQEKPKNKKYLVLSRAKKLTDRKPEPEKTKKALTFEIAGKSKNTDDDESSEADSDADEVKPSIEDLELAALAQKERKDKLNELRVKPTLMDRERERAFKRIATKGVVQLFNAVRSQQRDLVDRLEQAGPLDHKRDAVLNNINKRQFLDVLMGGKRAKSENIDNPVKEEEIKNESKADDQSNRPSQWSVLRDDFMTNKKTTSHWDKEEQDDDEGMAAGGDDSDWID